MSLNIPVVTPNHTVQLKQLQGLSHPKPYIYSFRCRNGLVAPIPKDMTTYQLSITTDSFTERPMMIWVGFQANKKTDQTFNHAFYKHHNVETMVIKMNNCQIPEKPIKSNWGEADNGMWYEDMLHQRANYLQFAGIYTDNTFINPENMRTMYCVYCFDVSKQSNLVSARSVNCELHVNFKTATPDDLRVYVAWYFDRSLELFTDGKSLNIKSHTDSYSQSH